MKKRKRSYTGAQKFILFCFFAIVLTSIALTGLLIHKSLNWMNAGSEPVTEEHTETVSPPDPTLQNPENAEPEETVSDGSSETPAGTETPQKPVRIPANNGEVWNLLLVNEWNKLPADFSVNLIELNNGHSIDRRAYPDLQDMMDAARAEGLSPILCSS